MAGTGNPWTSPEWRKKEEMGDLVNEIVREAISEREAQAEAAPGAAQPRKHRQMVMALVLGVLLVSVAMSMALPSLFAQRTIPDELIGEWITSDPRYMDRGFKLSRTSIAFYAGEGGTEVLVHPIDRVETSPAENGTLYVVQYSDSVGRTYQFSFFHERDPHSVIRFKNQQEMEWSKKGP